MRAKSIILAILIWSIDLLFCMCNRFVSSEQTSKVLMIVSAGLAVAIAVRLLTTKNKISQDELKTFALPLLVVIGLLFTILFRGENALAYSSLKCAICYAVPFTMLAIICYDGEEILFAGKYVDVLLVLFGIYLIYIVRNGIASQVNVRDLESVTNIGYQSTSYYGAYATVLGLYALMYVPIEGGTLKRILFFIFRVATVFIGALTAVYGSGKGAMVVIAIGILILLSYSKYKPKNFGRIVIIILISIPVLYYIMKTVTNNSALSHSFERIFALFGAGKLTYYNTSGRTLIYEKCLQAFGDSPLFGHGLGSAYYLLGQPHQMFLEIMVEGGIIYLTIWIVILVRTYSRIKWILKRDNDCVAGYLFLIVTFAMQFIQLQFSGFYNQSYTIWFFIAYVYLRSRYISESDYCDK